MILVNLCQMMNATVRNEDAAMLRCNESDDIYGVNPYGRFSQQHAPELASKHVWKVFVPKGGIQRLWTFACSCFARRFGCDQRS